MKSTAHPMCFLALVASFAITAQAKADTFGVETLNLRYVEQGWGQPHPNQSVDGHALSIGGKKYEHGLGTHAVSTMRIALGGKGASFTAIIGVDDEVGQRGSVVFKIIGDGKTLWESGVMRGGDVAKTASAALHGIKTLILSVGDAGDDMNFDHADWVEAKIVMVEGKPESLAPVREPAVVLTPKESPKPRNVWEWGAQVGGNCWRTTGDITDTWSSMAGIGFGQAGHQKYAGPGHWNDPDMLVVGYVGWSANVRPTRLTPNEQYTHITLWCLLCSPLLIGCDMTKLDTFTANLLTNDEVLEVSQDPLGRQAGRISRNGSAEIWAKEMEDGSKAVGLFNVGEDESPITVTWAELKLSGKHAVRDLWRQRNLGKFADEFQASVPRHGVVLIRVK